LKAGIKKERMSSTTSTDDAVSTVPLSSLSLNTITEEESKKITESQKDLKKEGGEVKTGGCEHCHKPNPTKRCSKRHPKCMKFMFCNEVCEKIVCQKVHQKKKAVPPPTTDQTGNDENQQQSAAAADEKKAKADAAAAAAAKAKKKAAKKAKKTGNGGTTRISGEFWWA